MDDSHEYILTDCEGGNPVSHLGVGGNVSLVKVDLGWLPKSIMCNPHLEVALKFGSLQTIQIKKNNLDKGI